MNESPCTHCDIRSCEDPYGFGDHECFEYTQTLLTLMGNKGIQIIRALTGQSLENQKDLYGNQGTTEKSK